MQLEYKPKVCQWIGNNEGCRQPVIFGKSYCETHYLRIYTVLTDEEIDTIVEIDLGPVKPILEEDE